MKSVTTTAASAPQAEPSTKDSSPVWKTQSNRVQGAVWKHDQKGKARYTIAISRSYRDQDGKWQTVHYFDRRDLKDVRAVCDQAESEISSLEGMTVAAGED